MHSAYFDDTTRFGFTASQLYATASYQAYDLAGIHLGYNDLSSWNFSGQSLFRASFYAAALTNANLSHANLTNADFLYATLSGADMTGADMRGARGLPVPPDAVADNLIRSDGRIFGLDLQAGEKLVVRDYDGRSTASPIPIPIQVTDHFVMAEGGVLRMVFEADDWGSTISFAAGIAVDLGGALELAFAPDMDLATQVGRTFQLFDWDGVTPVGLFDAIESDYVWDLSQLYASGDVTLVALSTAPTGDYNGDGAVDGLDYQEWRGQYGAVVSPGIGADGNADGVVDAADYTLWRDALSVANESSTAVPEPASLAMSVFAAAALVGAGGGRVFQLCPPVACT